MKALFPNTGIVVVTKANVDRLHQFYTDNLIESKLFTAYNSSNYPIQVGNLIYFPKKSNIVLHNADMLTLKKLHQILSSEFSQSNTQSEQETKKEQIVSENFDTPIDDNFIENHPFFKTLSQLD